jgi:hypothetical protein
MRHSPETDQYKVRRLDQKGLDDVSRLFAIVYGRNSGDSHFSKKYDTIYTGIENIGYLAYDSAEKPIAFYGVIPCFIKCGDRVFLAAQSADTMTHPLFRNKGLFTRLARLTFDLCKQAGIAFVFGFPNQNAYHGLIKLGWHGQQTMERFSIPIKAFPLEPISRKFPWIRRQYLLYAQRVVEKYFYSKQGLPNSVLTADIGGVYRDQNYLQYKTYSSSEVIRVDRAKVWFKIQNGFSIGDIEIVDGQQGFESTMDHLKTSPGTFLSDLFRKYYIAVPSFPILFLDLGANIDLSKLKFTFADIDVF